MKVRIQNFQSVEDVELEIEGFTTLVGKSNIGKSAVIRAIQGALTNLEGEDFVTNGKPHTEVHLECDGLDLLWKKGGGFNDYEINGESLESVGRGAPPHIGEAGFGELEVSRDTLNVQIADQFKPLFLLTETGSIAAEAISDVGRLADIQEALKDCQSDRRKARSTCKVREGDLDEVREDLQGFESFDQTKEHLDQLADLYSALRWGEQEIATLSAFQDRREKVLREIDAYAGIDSVDVPGWSDDDLVSECKALRSLKNRLVSALTASKQYEGVEDVDIPEWESDDLSSEIRTLSRYESRLSRARQELVRWEDVDSIDIPEMTSLEGEFTTLQMLEGWNQRLQALASEIPVLKQEVQDLDSQIHSVDEEFHTVLHEAGRCPTCEREVT